MEGGKVRRRKTWRWSSWERENWPLQRKKQQNLLSDQGPGWGTVSGQGDGRVNNNHDKVGTFLPSGKHPGRKKTWLKAAGRL